jgi:uncharacterized protein
MRVKPDSGAELEQDDVEAKEARLAAWLVERRRVAIGYSGGVDSAYLAAVALDSLGVDNVLAIIGVSASYPESQWSAARAVARRVPLALRIRRAHADDGEHVVAAE